MKDCAQHWSAVRLSIGLACVFGVGLVGCGGVDNTAFLPLKTPASWVYDAHSQTMNGKRLQRLFTRNEAEVIHSDGEPALLRSRGVDYRELVRLAPEGLLRLAVLRADANAHWAEDPAEPLLLLPRELLPGREWRQASRTQVLEATVDPFRRRYVVQEPVEMRYRVVANDAVIDTPAGRFSHCLLLEATGEGHFQGDKTVPGGNISVRQSEWYAAGVGLVRLDREETTSSSILPRGLYQLTLVNYRPD